MKDTTAAATTKSQPFTFGYAPPKEGRVPPAGVRLRRRRRATLIAILVLVVMFCLVLKYVQTSTLSTIKSKLDSEEAELRKEWKGTERKELVTEKQNPQNPLLAKVPTITTSSAIEILTTSEILVPTKVAVPAAELKKEKTGIPLRDNDKFDDLLENIVNLLPSEMNQRALLTPITTSGAERIHELGLRTREFKKLFEAWEELHFVFTGNSVYIQDDVISYLRSRESTLKVKQANRRSGGDEPFDLATTIRDYENFRWLLQSLGDVLFPWIKPYFGDHTSAHAQMYGGGKGIVFTAGTDQAPFVLTSIGVLRELGCDLPVEVMYLGDGDLDVDARERLEEIPGVITRDIRLMIKDEGWALAGWAGKPFAILFSSFREVIFIDADALFIQSPSVLFEDPSYKDTGALFFHDRLMKADGKRHWLETILPKPVSRKARKSRMWGTSDHNQESGVVVVDTFKHFIPLLVVSRMNGPDRDGNSDKGITGVYDMLFGDKETFWISWELVGSQAYSFHSGPAGIIGNLPDHHINVTHETTEIITGDFKRLQNSYEHNVSMCAPQLLHISRDGSPLWFNGWILANKFDKTKSPIAPLEMYMREPEQYQEPESWTIGESNSCCLRNAETYEFTVQEKKAIKIILDVAFKVGAVGRKGGVPRRGSSNLYD